MAAMVVPVNGGALPRRRQRLQRVRNTDQPRIQRQFLRQRLQFRPVAGEHEAALHGERLAHHIRRHERIAVTIPADPAAHAEE
jgi:hypothetical protein